MAQIAVANLITMLEVSGDSRITNTELHLLAMRAGTMANQGLTFTASLVIIMITFTDTSSILTDSAFRANHSSTRIRAYALSVYTDFMFAALDTST